MALFPLKRNSMQNDWQREKMEKNIQNQQALIDGLSSESKFDYKVFRA
jgi:hypothetical protein